MRRASFLRRVVSLSLLAGASALATTASAEVFYIHSDLGRPWGNTTDAAAMDQAFGAGNWGELTFETIDVASVFSRSSNFIWLEGGDNNALRLETFLDTNRAAVESWVNQGGGLYLNAAPNEGDGMSLVFGATLVYPIAGGSTATPQNTGSPVWQGPFTPVNQAMTGTAFAHASIASGGTGLLQDEGGGNFELTTFWSGSGQVVLGGLTPTQFWSPAGPPQNLRANIARYLSDLDGDGAYIDDNCLAVWNPDQADSDGDGVGDLCDDDDGDGVLDLFDNCPTIANAAQADIDGDSQGDACDDDDDGDGVDDDADNCVGIANPGQEDDDDNGAGDACQSGAEPLDVLVLHDDISFAGDAIAKLEATGRFASVSEMIGQPSLATLASYDAVLAFNVFGLDDPDGFGNVLADYADQGGGLVIAVFGFSDFYGYKGRLVSADYLPFMLGDQTQGVQMFLVPELPDHPLMADVDSFDGGPSSYHNAPLWAATGATLAATWTDGQPLIAGKITGGARVAGLNFFPASDDVLGYGFWNPTTDGATLMANALEWAGGCDGVDLDDDGIPDACDSIIDSDGDSVADDVDNCIDVANLDQEDLDDDGIGDACDDLIDSDDDGVADDEDNCIDDPNADQLDTDSDGDGNVCDDDDDGDGIDDGPDNCELVANPNQADGDDDGVGDACEDDVDGDGIADDEDNCPITANPNQADADHDGIGDACDSSGEGGAGEGGAGEGGDPVGAGGAGDGGSAGPGPTVTSGAGASGSGGSGGSSGSGTGAAGGSGGSGDAGDAADDSGCGCEVPGGAPAPRGGWLAAMVAGVAVALRRRPRRRAV